MLHVVQNSSYTVALTLSSPPPAAPKPEPPKNRRPPPPAQNHRSWFGYAPPVPPSTPAAKPAAIPPTPVVAEAPPAPPKIEAVSAMTFNELDGALQASPTTQSLDARSQKSGVTMRILSAGKVVDRDAIKIAIADTGTAPFFVSIFKVSAGGKTIASESVGPYVANPGEEIAVIVHFDAAAASGKKVALTMIESGGEHRRFVMTPDHVF